MAIPTSRTKEVARITIDQEKCNGCGLCVSGCPEGALRVIDGKARLVGDLLCDGLGACMGSCPEDAISVIEREAEPYDEIRVLENIIPQGRNVLQAHLEHLRSHGQSDYLQQALTYLGEHKIAVELPQESAACQTSGGHCPGSQSRAFVAPQDGQEDGDFLRQGWFHTQRLHPAQQFQQFIVPAAAQGQLPS